MRGALVKNLKQLVNVYELTLSEFSHEIAKVKSRGVIEYLKGDDVIVNIIEPDPYSSHKITSMDLCIVNTKKQAYRMYAYGNRS